GGRRTERLRGRGGDSSRRVPDSTVTGGCSRVPTASRQWRSRRTRKGHLRFPASSRRSATLARRSAAISTTWWLRTTRRPPCGSLPPGTSLEARGTPAPGGRRAARRVQRAEAGRATGRRGCRGDRGHRRGNHAGVSADRAGDRHRDAATGTLRRARRTGADAALAAAQHAYARAVRLVQAGILPQKDSDQTAADLAQAQATAVLAHRSQQLATLRAPLAGVVTRMSAVLGASVDQTQPLVEVADP